MRVGLRGVVFVTQAEIQRQVVPNLPGILAVKVERGSSDSIHSVRELEVVVGEAGYKICESITCEATTSYKVAEIKAAVGEEIEIEIVANAANVRAELHIMRSLVPGEIVLPMKGRVVQCGGSLGGRSQIE